MKLMLAALAGLLVLALVLAGATRVVVWDIGRQHPPVGRFAEIDGARVHNVHVPGPAGATLPPIVFIHGASANLKDQMLPLRPLLEGQAELLFFDRPGYGWSSRGEGHGNPAGQARLLARLMDSVGIRRAIVVGHSFGGALAAAFALEYPQRVAGLVFLSAATHPWPGGKTSWYYELAARPVLGRLFTETVAALAGRARVAGATECVFAPNAAPADYTERASIALVLRPAAFRANAADVEGLFAHVSANAPRYRSIAAPTVVISGDRDGVVFEEIHSAGLARDIPGAEPVWVSNLGHKPDWVAPDLVLAAIAKVAGRPVDLAAAARAVERRIAADRYGEGRCIDEKPQAEVQAPP